MLHVLFQIWGGSFYLLNKIFFSRAERSHGKAKATWRTWSWVMYLLGLPPWVIIFSMERNWMAASVEASGAAAMVLGLIISIRGIKKAPVWLDLIALFGAIGGMGYSFYDLEGFNSLSQWLEIGVVIGFLSGTYLLAKQKAQGYLFLILMNVSNALLMFTQGYHWLAAQQMVSLVFVADAYLMQSRSVPLAPAVEA